MKTRVMVLILTAFIVTTQWGRAFAADPAGYAMVDKLLLLFEGMNTMAPDVDNELQQMMAMAKKAKAEKRIDQEFYDRYTRLLQVVKLITMPDRERILAPIADREFIAFVRDTSGQEGDQVKPETRPSIGALAKAITQELASLKKHLDQK